MRARIYESEIEIWDEQSCLCRIETNPNAGGARIDYRHLLMDLLRKPGAFARYRYHEAFIPGEIWRQCYDHLLDQYSESRAGKEYLSILALTLDHPQIEIEQSLFLLCARVEISLDKLKSELGLLKQPEDYRDYIVAVDLSVYDNELLAGACHE